MTNEIMKLADAYASRSGGYFSNNTVTLGEVADARDALYAKMASTVVELKAAQNDVTRLQAQIELRRGQFASAEFAVKERDAEIAMLRTLLTEALDSDTNDYFFGSGLADRMRAALEHQAATNDRL